MTKSTNQIKLLFLWVDGDWATIGPFIKLESHMTRKNFDHQCQKQSGLVSITRKTPRPRPRPRHKTKQSDYKVEQSSFTLIALFWHEIGRCRGRNWLNGNQALLLSRSATTLLLSRSVTTLKVGHMARLCRSQPKYVIWIVPTFTRGNQINTKEILSFQTAKACMLQLI